MSNETTQKRSLSVSLGAAFLMATSAIGPGFLTQTSQFTAKYLSSFAFVIVCVIIMDTLPSRRCPTLPSSSRNEPAPFREPVCPTGRLRLKGERYVRHQIPAQR